MLSRLKLLILAQLLRPVLVCRFAEASRIVRCTILQMRGREVWGAAYERATRDGMLVIAKVVTVPANTTVLLMLVAQMMCLVVMVLALKTFVQSHLILVIVACPAIQQAMVLPVAAVIVHAAVRIVCRRMGAR